VSGWVREVDEEHRRLSLSLREVSTSDPWEGLAEKMPEGSVVSGQVENVAVFGVFVRLDIGLTGLIPNSETGLPHGTPATKSFTPGQKVEVKVIGLDAQRRRISLSSTGALAEAERGEIRKYREETAKRERSEPGRPTNFGASLMAALSTPNKAAKSAR
jgi:small subunit ribosomal protein S1